MTLVKSNVTRDSSRRTFTSWRHVYLARVWRYARLENILMASVGTFENREGERAHPPAITYTHFGKFAVSPFQTSVGRKPLLRLSKDSHSRGSSSASWCCFFSFFPFFFFFFVIYWSFFFRSFIILFFLLSFCFHWLLLLARSQISLDFVGRYPQDGPKVVSFFLIKRQNMRKDKFC